MTLGPHLALLVPIGVEPPVPWPVFLKQCRGFSVLTLWLSELLLVFPDCGADQSIRPLNPS